jgi:hypothetical protein
VYCLLRIADCVLCSVLRVCVGVCVVCATYGLRGEVVRGECMLSGTTFNIVMINIVGQINVKYYSVP